MEQAGIPPRYRKAKLSTNCQRYAGDPEKARALELAEELAREGRIEQRGRMRFCLLLSGQFGTGKSWLATAIFKALLWHSTGGIWTKYWDFIDDIQSGYSDGTALRKRRRYQNTPVLMLDDLGDLEHDETRDRRMNLYKVIDTRNDYFRPTLITTNLDTTQLVQNFGQRTWERIKEMAALVGMEGTNLRDEGLADDEYPRPD